MTAQLTLRFVASVLLLCTPRALAQATTPDEALWTTIEMLSRSTPATEPFEARFALELARRQLLLERTQSYLRIYPGGARRDEAVARELETLFEIAALKTDYAPLATRIREYLSAPPNEAARAEAAWWSIHCDALRATATRPAAKSLADGDRELLAALAKYTEQFPRSRHALRALVRLADDARDRGDMPAAATWTARLASDFPDNPLAEAAVARLRLAEAVGRPFVAKLRSVEGTEFDSARFAGDVVLIVAWDSTCPEARDFARNIDGFVASGPRRRAVGVCIAETADATKSAVRDLGLGWPQCNDGLGRAGEFLRTWGIRETPAVLVIDRAGRLAGWGDAHGWKALAERAAAGEIAASRPAN